jgi:hypothetical protein
MMRPATPGPPRMQILVPGAYATPLNQQTVPFTSVGSPATSRFISDVRLVKSISLMLMTSVITPILPCLLGWHRLGVSCLAPTASRSVTTCQYLTVANRPPSFGWALTARKWQGGRLATGLPSEYGNPIRHRCPTGLWSCPGENASNLSRPALSLLRLGFPWYSVRLRCRSDWAYPRLCVTL